MTYRAPAPPEPPPPPDPGARRALTLARARWWAVHIGPIGAVAAGAATLYAGAWIGVPIMVVAALVMRVFRVAGVLDSADAAVTVAKTRAGMIAPVRVPSPPHPRAWVPWAIGAALAFAAAPAACAIGWNAEAGAALYLYAITLVLALAFVLGLVARNRWTAGNGVRRVYEQAAELEDKLLGHAPDPRVRIAEATAPAPSTADAEEVPLVDATGASTRSDTR